LFSGFTNTRKRFWNPWLEEMGFDQRSVKNMGNKSIQIPEWKD
jgi:hypothetical protein